MEGMDFLDHEDLVDFGYTWKGMVGISRSLANAFYEIMQYMFFMMTIQKALLTRNINWI